MIRIGDEACTAGRTWWRTSACASGLSGEMPTISASSFANFFEQSRNSHASLVQPGVSDLGKKKSTTRLPRSFES